MTVPEQFASLVQADAGHPPAPLPTRQQRQILQLLAPGDRLWEIADDQDHYTGYHEKRGRDQRVPAAVVTALEEQGWIQKRPNPHPDRLDSWEITPQGRTLLSYPAQRPSQRPSSRKRDGVGSPPDADPGR
jgi:hypothetical protein